MSQQYRPIICDFCGAEIFKPRMPIPIDEHTSIDIDNALLWGGSNCVDKHTKDVCPVCLVKMLEKFVEENK